MLIGRHSSGVNPAIKYTIDNIIISAAHTVMEPIENHNGDDLFDIESPKDRFAVSHNTSLFIDLPSWKVY